MQIEDIDSPPHSAHGTLFYDWEGSLFRKENQDDCSPKCATMSNEPIIFLDPGILFLYVLTGFHKIIRRSKGLIDSRNFLFKSDQRV